MTLGESRGSPSARMAVTQLTVTQPRLTPCPSCGASFLVEKETKKHGLVLRCLKCKSQFQPETLGVEANT